jgi:IclR family pca regulon transcriptional regulator
VRRDGHALVAQELELGLCSIAVPVRTGNGRVVAGLNVGMAYSDGVRERALKRVLPVLLRTRESIERTLARSGWLPAAEVRRA